MKRELLTEATGTLQATPVEGKPGRFLIQLISPGWGSSGYYSADVLEAAAAAKVFPAGLHMYLDHPTATEQYDRPERSVRDLAAVLADDATWNGQAIVGEATVFGPYREVLEQMKDTIGVSIRAGADVGPGEAEGRMGTIVNELVEGVSADFVTHAGRGGKIVQVLESARAQIAENMTRDTALAQLAESRNVGQWIESRLHLALTQIADDMYGDGRLSREERIALSSAVGDALDAFTADLEKDAPQLYQRDLWDDPSVMAQQVDEATRSVPVTRPGSTTQESTTQEEPIMGHIQVDEAEHRRLTEAAGRVQTLESERDAAVQRAETAESERDQAIEKVAKGERAKVVAKILGESATAAGVQLDQYQRSGIAGHAVLADDGTVNESETRKAFDTHVATLAEANGKGRPRGMGGKVHSTTQESNVDDIDAELDALAESAFGPLSVIKEA